MLGSDGFTTDSNPIDISISADAFVTLNLTKNVSPALTSGSQLFQFHVSGTTGGNAVDLRDPSLTFSAGQTQLSLTPPETGLLPDTYNVTEDPVTGWINDSPQTVILNLPTCSGTVTFNNTQEAQIVVKKVTVPSGSTQSFAFTPSYEPGFGLTDGTSNTSGFLTLASGYSVSEAAVTGWDLTGHTCDNGNDPSAITLAAGQTVTCTFTNTQRGTIIVKKVTSPAGGTGFTFTGDAAGTIDDGGNITVNNLVPGTYHSTESAKTGWDLTNLDGW